MAQYEEMIERLAKINAELKKLNGRDPLNKYNSGPVHQKQMMFHKCQKRFRWVFGGNRSGKTECGAVETVWHALGTHPFRKINKDTEGWVVSLSTQVQRDVAQKKILSYLDKRNIISIVMLKGEKSAPEEGVIDYILVKNARLGVSRIGFKSCDQGREKFQGASLDYVWFDEEPPKEIYEECRMRVMDRCGDIWVTMTPLKGLTWVYDDIYINARNDPNIWHITMEWADNPFLPPAEIEAMAKSMSEEELQSRRYGKFVRRYGLVYPEFDQSVHVIEPFEVPREWYDNISIDPGLNNPLSAHWYAVDYDGTIYVIAEHYEAGKDIVYHAQKIKEISDGLGWPCHNGKLNALIDSAAAQRTLAGIKSVAELFYEHGINVNTKVNKDLFTGIQRVKAKLKVNDGKAGIYIFPQCVNLIRELKSYQWGAGDIPKKCDDHALDELRYYIMSRPAPPLLPVKKSPITLHKERLIRKLKNRRS